MTLKIKSVELSQAVPGMILAAPVRDAAGGELLAEGAELTAAMLASLARRGVMLLRIAEEEHLTQEELAARRAEVAERLNFLFRGGIDPLRAELHKIVLDYRLEGLL